MAMQPLPYLSTQATSDLWERRNENLDRYTQGSFDEELHAAGAQLVLNVLVDIDGLSSLDASASDLDNAKVVWAALSSLTANLARENRVWTRLCHGEALTYSRSRWLAGQSGEALPEAVGAHMFARTLTQCRDDNALGRLWWTAFVAHQISAEDFEGVLALLLKTADIRSNFVERTWMTARPAIARAIVRAMKSDPWVTSVEKNFRETMKALNVMGAGVAFEVLPESKADEIVGNSIAHAKLTDGVSS